MMIAVKNILTMDPRKIYSRIMRIIRGSRGNYARHLPAPILMPNSVVQISLDKLKTANDHPYRSEYVDKGFAYFGVSVSDTPHFKFIENYLRNHEMDLSGSMYCAVVDLRLSIHRKQSDDDYMHNGRDVIKSAEQMGIRFIELYEEIKSNGLLNPIQVTATHNGKYVITDGLHRAAIACAIGLETIPARITRADRQLETLMHELRGDYPNKGHEALYSPIEHPIFSEWSVIRDDSRWVLIKDAYDWRGKTILDIGCYTGYFTNKIAELGGKVTGIDVDDHRLSQSRQINKLLESDVNLVNADFNEYLKDKKFDCIIFFSVLHWILKNEGLDGMRRALDILSSAAPTMIFDMGQNNECKMKSLEWTHGIIINQETLPGLVISNSKYTNFDHLGTGSTGRDVFMFTRESTSDA